MFDAVVAADTNGVHTTQAIFEGGQSRIELGRDDEAAPLFELVLSRSDNERFELYALRHLGAIAMRDGRPEDASRWLGRAEALAAGDGAVAGALAVDRARALLAAGQAPEAASVLAPYANGSGSDETLAWYAVARSRAGEHDSAIRVFDSLNFGRLERGFKRVAQYERSVAYRSVGRGDDAVELLRELLVDGLDDQTSGFATLDLGTLLIDDEKYAEGASLLETVLSEGADVSDEVCAAATYQAAWARYKLGEYAAVIALLDKKAIRCELGDLVVPAAMVHGESLLSLGRARAAAERFVLIVEGDRSAAEYGTALLRLGEARAAAQEWQASLEAFRRYRESFPESDLWFRAEFGIGWALENSGQQQEAIEAYRPVCDGRQGETAARAQFQIGECLFALGRHEEAVAELLKVDILHAEPEWSAAALYEAGRCFEAMNKIGEARQQYRSVRERFEESKWSALAVERLERMGTGSPRGGSVRRGGSR